MAHETAEKIKRWLPTVLGICAIVVFFILSPLGHLEKELEQRNINYKFGYDWRLGSVFEGGELPVLIESQKGN